MIFDNAYFYDTCEFLVRSASIGNSYVKIGLETWP